MHISTLALALALLGLCSLAAVIQVHYSDQASRSTSQGHISLPSPAPTATTHPLAGREATVLPDAGNSHRRAQPVAPDPQKEKRSGKGLGAAAIVGIVVAVVLVVLVLACVLNRMWRFYS